MTENTLPAASLQNLNDIVEPAAVPLWPPAPGWYVLAGLLLLITSWCVYRMVRRWHMNRYRRLALEELDQMRQAASWRNLPGLVKRTALAAYPRTQVASLGGNEWLEFLRATRGKSSLAPGTGALLLRAAYETGELGEAEQAALFTATEKWIRRHQSRGS